MTALSRRHFVRAAAALGAALAYGSAAEAKGWSERRDLYPQGVASGDPEPDSVMLWTRRPPAGAPARRLTVEVSPTADFRRIVARGQADLSADTDWTVRFLAAGLKPRTEYFYRFTDEHGFGSRVGRTLTAPALSDGAAVKFAFVSCQNITQGACNAYRRMIFEDQARPAAEQLGFVMHLGDFIYEITWYSADRPTYYDRKVKDVYRLPDGKKRSDFHVPTSLEDYRTLYRAYLQDPDLQDARARWPFVMSWDNHEFSWQAWQTQQEFGEGPIPAQSLKVIANQAWWEAMPARVVKAGGDRSLDRFSAPKVTDTPLAKVDDEGFSDEPNNLAALSSLTIYRGFRYGKHAEFMITDNRSYASAGVGAEAEPFTPKGFPFVADEHSLEIMDAGRLYPGGPPDTIRFGGKDLPNPSKNAPRQAVLGKVQREWLIDRLRRSKARWKVWGNPFGMLQQRIDYQNLPAGDGPKWPGEGYGTSTSPDWERREVLEALDREKITGLVSVAGDRHSFWAGTMSPGLPPRPFRPVGVEFITGSISAPGLSESLKYGMTKNPLKPLFAAKQPDGSFASTVNMTFLHGVRTTLEWVRSGDRKAALALRNPDLAPHLKFVDMGGHGYATVRLSDDRVETEFVCVPRPIERAATPDGGPLAYRVAHRVRPWRPGETPVLEQTVLEGEPPLST
jgi:alkaline phosphatase D